jgi:hypothetical protein
MIASLDMARNPHKLFWQQVPRGFLLDSVKCLFKSYEAGYEDCSQLPNEEAHDLRPYCRRAHFEAGWRDTAARHKGQGVVASAHHNKANNWNHTHVRCGQVVLTQSAVEFPTQMVRHAEFREGYARSNQLSLFDPAVPPSPDAPLYCILLHGVSDDPRIPLFVRIVFPTPDCSGYVEGSSIDLLAEFKDEMKQTRKVSKRNAKPKSKPEVA